MVRKILILAVSLATLGAATAAAAVSPTWNSGCGNWWPAGFGYPPVTAQARGYPCSVTAYGPTFHSGPKGGPRTTAAGPAAPAGWA